MQYLFAIVCRSELCSLSRSPDVVDASLSATPGCVNRSKGGGGLTEGGYYYDSTCTLSQHTSTCAANTATECFMFSSHLRRSSTSCRSRLISSRRVSRCLVSLTRSDCILACLVTLVAICSWSCCSEDWASSSSYRALLSSSWRVSRAEPCVARAYCGSTGYISECVIGC